MAESLGAPHAALTTVRQTNAAIVSCYDALLRASVAETAGEDNMFKLDTAEVLDELATSIFPHAALTTVRQTNAALVSCYDALLRASVAETAGEDNMFKLDTAEVLDELATSIFTAGPVMDSTISTAAVVEILAAAAAAVSAYSTISTAAVVEILAVAAAAVSAAAKPAEDEEDSQSDDDDDADKRRSTILAPSLSPPKRKKNARRRTNTNT